MEVRNSLSPLNSFIMMSDTDKVSRCESSHQRSGALDAWRESSGPSRMARQRLKWMDYNEAHGKNAALTCRYFGISHQTFHRWKRRYNPRDPTTLEERSHRPQRVRQPTWSPELAQAVLELREERPGWGKDKLAVLLQKDGWQAPVSMVGRILTSLKARGVLREPPANGISARKRQRARPYAVRKPKEYQAKEPGDLVQVDTWTSDPCLGWSSSISPHGMWSPAGTWSRFIPGPRPLLPRPSWIPSRPGCLSHSRPSRWMEAASSKQALSRPANSAVYTCSSYLPGHPSSMAMWSGPSGPIPRSSMKSTRTTWRSFL